MTAESRHVTKRNSLEAVLATCRAERQRLISENATLLLRALTAEEAVARMQRRTPHALKMTDDRPEASNVCSGRRSTFSIGGAIGPRRLSHVTRRPGMGASEPTFHSSTLNVGASVYRSASTGYR